MFMDAETSNRGSPIAMAETVIWYLAMTAAPGKKAQGDGRRVTAAAC